jgi:hypothetical protein
MAQIALIKSEKRYLEYLESRNAQLVASNSRYANGIEGPRKEAISIAVGEREKAAAAIMVTLRHWPLSIQPGEDWVMPGATQLQQYRWRLMCSWKC